MAKGSGPQRGATAGRAHQVRVPFGRSKLRRVSHEADGDVPEAGEAESRQSARLSRQLHHAEAQLASRRVREKRQQLADDRTDRDQRFRSGETLRHTFRRRQPEQLSQVNHVVKLTRFCEKQRRAKRIMKRVNERSIHTFSHNRDLWVVGIFLAFLAPVPIFTK